LSACVRPNLTSRAGALGHGDRGDVAAPRCVEGLPPCTHIAGDQLSFAIGASSNQLWCWGDVQEAGATVAALVPQLFEQLRGAI